MKRFDLKLAIIIAVISIIIGFYQATAWSMEVIDKWETTPSGLVKIHVKGEPEGFWRLHITKNTRECVGIGTPIAMNNEMVLCTDSEFKRYCYWLEHEPIGTINGSEEFKSLIEKTGK